MQKTKPFRGLGSLKRKEIGILFQTARRIYADNSLDIRRAPGTSNGGRVLVVASRRIGTAPLRNKFKRRIKHIFFENDVWQAPYDWIIVLRPKVALIPFANLRDLLLQKMHQ